MKTFFDTSVKHNSNQKPKTNPKIEEIEDEGDQFYDGDVTSEDEVDTEGFIVLEEVFPSGSVPKMTITKESHISMNNSESILESSDTLITPRTDELMRDSGNFSSFGDSSKFVTDDEFEDHPAILEFMK
jgi:hypothetical protein